MPQFIMIQTYLDLGLGTDTWSDEDFIGRVSRVNRRVNTIESPIQTIKKCLIHYKMGMGESLCHLSSGLVKDAAQLVACKQGQQGVLMTGQGGNFGEFNGPTKGNISRRTLFYKSSIICEFEHFLPRTLF